jgi:hypothetical protein
MREISPLPRNRLSIALLIFFLLAGGRVSWAREEGVYRIPVILTPSLESRRSELEASLMEAQRRLVAFADENGWHEHVTSSFLTSAKIYDDKVSFDASLRELFGMEGSSKIPLTYAAAVKSGTLIALSPDIYMRNYPQGVEVDCYEKLLCHELVHELHIRILKYDEEAMGPLWFYEGFAVYGSGQFEDSLPELTENALWNIVRSTKRQSYKKYGALIRYFLKKASLQELVSHAGKADFITWLKGLPPRE